MEESSKLLAGVIVVGGGWFLLTRTGALAGSGLGLDDLGLIRHEATPAEQAQAMALRQPGAGNAPVLAAPAFNGGPVNLLAPIAGVGVAALPLLGVGGAALGFATAGIGLAVAFATYALLKQRASMHTNDVRDVWQKQFIALHHALGIRPLTAEQTLGSGPGNIEMAEVIFYFDQDRTQALWKAVTKTQDERQFRAAAANVDAFLTAHGVPGQDIA